jgi:hypothetical protein
MTGLRAIARENFWFSSTLLINSFEPWVIIVVISLLELCCHLVFTEIVGELLVFFLGGGGVLSAAALYYVN